MAKRWAAARREVRAAAVPGGADSVGGDVARDRGRRRLGVRQWALLDNPHRVGKPLRFELEGYYSARRGQYRVIYRIAEREVIVDVIQISHRSDAYG